VRRSKPINSVEDQHPTSEVLRKEIRNQSDDEAASILEQAKKESDKILSDAEKEARKIKTELLKKAELQANGIRKRILSGVHVEIKRQNLRAREELISKVFQMVAKRLDAFRQSDTYIVFIRKMVKEGVLALDADEFRILHGNVEKQRLTKKILSEMEKELSIETGRKVKLVLSDQVLPEGGVVLISSDERMLFDNRFSARMERMEDEMRLVVMKRVMG
jgi:V/A-type H+-transporting ATPase subunit E